jgi:carbamoyl-phosphate synthase large subunit
MNEDSRQSLLVTGVGGGVGQSLLKALYGSRYRIIAADGERLATGLFAADRGYTVPYAADPRYVDRIIEICIREKCKLIFPGLDAELPVLAGAQDKFRAKGISCVVSSPKVVEICDDKLLTARFLEQAGLHAARTCAPDVPGDAVGIGFPLILKPKKGGHRSIGVELVRNATELEHRMQAAAPGYYVAQEWIDGDEYTCGTVNFEGRCAGTIVMRRVLRNGDTYKAFVVQDPAIESTVRKAAEALAPFGACNFQLRVRDNASYIFEINARSSGTTYSRALAGFNEPVMVADFLLHGIEPRPAIRPISVMRYWNELEVDQERIDSLAAEGWIEGNGSSL